MLGCAQAAAAELGWNRRLNMALEAAKGMLYLHSRADAVLHRDLKSANLLVDKHWRVKVADFNLSRVMNASVVVSSVSATNPRYGSQPLLADLSRAWMGCSCFLSQNNDFVVHTDSFDLVIQVFLNHYLARLAACLLSNPRDNCDVGIPPRLPPGFLSTRALLLDGLWLSYMLMAFGKPMWTCLWCCAGGWRRRCWQARATIAPQMSSPLASSSGSSSPGASPGRTWAPGRCTCLPL